MTYHYRTKGTCSTAIAFDIDEGIIHHVSFTNGCNGNLKAIGKLVEGMPADRVAALLKGNTCGQNSTSCADQLSIAITQALAAQKKA